MRLTGFSSELMKVAGAVPPHVQHALLQKQMAREYEGYKDTQKPLGTARAAVAGAAGASVLPVILGMSPWLADSEGRAAELEVQKQQAFLREYVKRTLQETTGKSISDNTVATVARDIERSMNRAPSPASEDFMRQMRWTLGQDPVIGEKLQKHMEDVVHELGHAGHSVDTSNPDVVAKIHRMAQERLGRAGEIPAYRDIVPTREAYQKALQKGEQYLGKNMPSDGALKLQNLAKQLRRTAGGAIPFALIGGVGAATAFRRRKKEAQEVLGQKTAAQVAGPSMTDVGEAPSSGMMNSEEESAPSHGVLGASVEQIGKTQSIGYPIIEPPPGYVFRPDLMAFVADPQQPGWMTEEQAAQGENNQGYYMAGQQDAMTAPPPEMQQPGDPNAAMQEDLNAAAGAQGMDPQQAAAMEQAPAQAAPPPADSKPKPKKKESEKSDKTEKKPGKGAIHINIGR